MICEWAENEDAQWASHCGHLFEFMAEGGPVAHDFAHCPFCGRRITAVAFMPSIDEDEDEATA